MMRLISITVVAISLALLLAPAEASAFKGQAAAFRAIALAAKRLDTATHAFSAATDRCQTGPCYASATRKMKRPASNVAHAIARAARKAPAGSQCQKRLKVSADDMARARNAIDALAHDFEQSDIAGARASLAKFKSAINHFVHDFKVAKKRC